MKKLSVAKQVLNILNTKGGKKPKQIIAETKASAGAVYNALNLLRKKKMIAKEEDGVYISQTQTSVSKSTNKPKAVAKRGRPRKTTTAKRMPLYNENLVKENQQLAEWTMTWKQKYDKLEADYTQAKIMYLNSQAVVAYLEEKVAQLLRG
jgi:hypothetical protein